VAGFKDVIHRWKAEEVDPGQARGPLQAAGAPIPSSPSNAPRTNLDLWDSKYQPWNSVRVGPQKDLIAGWAKAARAPTA